MVHDPVNHPTHYTSDAKCESCGHEIECIEVVRHLPFARGNAIKYLWRAGKKGATVEDLKKAVWYIQDEIAQLEGHPNLNIDSPSAALTEAVAKIRSVSETDTALEVSIDWNEANPPIGKYVTMPHPDPCEFSIGFWSSDGYTFICSAHGRTRVMPIDKKPESCLEGS